MGLPKLSRETKLSGAHENTIVLHVTRSVHKIHNSKFGRYENKRSCQVILLTLVLLVSRKMGKNIKGCTCAKMMHGVIACVEAQAARDKGTSCVHDLERAVLPAGKKN